MESPTYLKPHQPDFTKKDRPKLSRANKQLEVPSKGKNAM